MSLITDMVVMTVLDERAAMERVNTWCAEHDRRYEHGQTFNGLIRPAFSPVDTDEAGGAKVFCAYLWAMAGNYFPYEELIPVWGSFGWRCADGALLLVSSELDWTSAIQVYRGDGRRLVDDCPPSPRAE